MLRTTVCAALALTALATTPAGATPCLTDRRGDVVTAPAAFPVDAPHLDLVRLSFARSGRDLVATFHTAGGPGNGTWSMYFEYGDSYQFYVRARRDQGLPWAARPDPRQSVPTAYAELIRWGPRAANGTRVGVGRELTGVTASFAAGAVRVRFPVAQLGAATPKAGAVPRVPWARARQEPVAGVHYEDDAGCGFL